eukprot:3309108-Pyramimonas_sp.AAC.1
MFTYDTPVGADGGASDDNQPSLYPEDEDDNQPLVFPEDKPQFTERAKFDKKRVNTVHDDADEHTEGLRRKKKMR